MACGVTLLIREPELLGRIHTPAITEPPAEVLTTTLRRGAPLSLAAAQIPTFTLATPTATVAERPTIQTPELLPEAAPDTQATSTPVRAVRTAAASSTTPIRMLESPQAKTMFMQVRTALSTGTIATAVTGRPTVAADGSR